ncbi:hypothetical protein [Planotetraspora sp. GP83]|uniref:hypothetical protein n=1 Tax=Planotetraspora sp. GP83 TaxID=3156264 RepID=UPI0035153A38
MRPLLTAAVLLTAAALSTAPPAAATSHSPHNLDNVQVKAARAAVTDIREIVNTLQVQVQIANNESGQWFTIQPNSRWTGSMWVPWVGNQDELKSKSITVLYTDTGSDYGYYLFQDYWDPGDKVKFTSVVRPSYKGSYFVGGDSTGGGRKRLIIGKGSFTMEKTT